ncbi:MAG: T9SS type A sorting domain-containing protein [Bacteroidota bacterium]
MAPSLTDAKNQRRAVSGMGISASNWYLVYESMGDAWLTLSTDNGASWIREERLNVLQGVASNPTISNVISFGGSDVSRLVVSWLEQNGGTTELHLQGMEVQLGSGHCYYGWNSLTDQRNSDNHKVITDFNGPSPSTSARPVIRLDKEVYAPNVLFLYAYERGAGGIVVGRLQLSSNAYNWVADLTTATRTDGLAWHRTVSTSSSDCYPVIVTYPSVYGYPARTCIYYLAVGYAVGLRVAQYDYLAQQTSVLAAGYSDYTFTSLQGATNAGGANFGLVADAHDGGGNHHVNYYYKPTYYGSGTPQLLTSYVGVRQPTLMVENVGGFGSPTVEINVVSQDFSTWYKANGSAGMTSFGTGTAGIFTREQVGSGDRASIPTRTSVSPAQLYRYSGSGSLSKSGGNLPVDLCAFRYWTSDGKSEHPLILDFSGAGVTLVDSLENDWTVCAVKVDELASNGVIVSEPDSLAIPLQVDLLKSGRSVRSFASSEWNTLSSGSIPEFSPGDILKFSLTLPLQKTRGYLQVSLRESAALKAESSERKGEMLSASPQTMSAYPNPFNPATRFSFQLSEPGFVNLTIFDVLGRTVEELLSGMNDAGLLSVVWNARSEASGTYYARLTVSDESGKSLFTKSIRLLLVK